MRSKFTVAVVDCSCTVGGRRSRPCFATITAVTAVSHWCELLNKQAYCGWEGSAPISEAQFHTCQYLAGKFSITAENELTGYLIKYCPVFCQTQLLCTNFNFTFRFMRFGPKLGLHSVHYTQDFVDMIYNSFMTHETHKSVSITTSTKFLQDLLCTITTKIRLTLSFAAPSNAKLFAGFPAGILYTRNHSFVAWN